MGDVPGAILQRPLSTAASNFAQEARSRIARFERGDSILGSFQFEFEAVGALLRGSFRAEEAVKKQERAHATNDQAENEWDDGAKKSSECHARKRASGSKTADNLRPRIASPVFRRTGAF